VSIINNQPSETIRNITFRLREDVSQQTGTLIPGKFLKRYYGTSDIPSIEQSISDLMDGNKEPEEDVFFDLTIYGKLNGILLTFLALDIENWSDVYGLVYISPGEDPIRYLPRESPIVR
jgi:hypothetical protein